MAPRDVCSFALVSRGHGVWFVCGWQVKLCDPLVTRGPYLSALEIRSLYIKRYVNLPSLLYFTLLLFTDLTVLRAQKH